AEDAEGDEAVAGGQSADKMPAFVQNHLQEDGEQQKQYGGQKDSCHLQGAEFGKPAAYTVERVSYDQRSYAYHSSRADTRSDYEASYEIEYFLHSGSVVASTGKGIPAEGIIR
ncbi:hypothetical protein ABHZ33_01060, partial [Bacteroides uniformis]